MATDTPDPPVPPPRWEFLLSHHHPPRWSRTLKVSWGSRTLHLCSRCSGLGLGIVGLVLLFLISTRLPVAFTAPEFQLPFVVAPLAAAWDWTTQSQGRRESTNTFRLVSGTLLGLAYTDALSLLLLHEWLEVAIAALVFLAYAGTILLALQRTGSLARVVAEHFPDRA